MTTLKFDQQLEINGQKLNKKYIQSLSKQQRLDLIDPIFNLLRGNGWIYPDDKSKLNKSWKSLLEFQPDLNAADIFNNSSLATNICKFFCPQFYLATERDKPTLIDNFNNDEVLKKIIYNRLGLGWLDADEKGSGVNEAFNLSFKMIAIQGQRSMRLVNATSMFKPSIAKYMALKYSQENDTIFDYSCGFGGRLLGSMAANRKYIGTDPMTTNELTTMAEYFKFDKERYTLINSGSELYRGEENSIDLSYSSPPYLEQEYYSDDPRQAYNQGEDHFYNVYWKGTLENIKYMLKSGKVFGLNILEKYSKMVDMAKEQFGEPFEIIKLRTVRSHLTKHRGSEGGMAAEKFEPIYIFRNNK
jgi:hypothetical protein